MSSPSSDIYDTMFSDSTRGDISPSELGSGEGSGDDDFTVFDTTFFVDSSAFTTIEKSDIPPVSGATTESKTGTTEFGMEVTESPEIIEETDAMAEGSGATVEEETDTSASSEGTTMEGTQAATTESGSAFLSSTLVRIFQRRSLL